MSQVFLKIVNMSISAGWLVLFVLLLRKLLERAPKWVNVLLWGLVAVRLVFPFSIQSALSLLPSGETIPPNFETADSPAIHSGLPVIDNAVNPSLEYSNVPMTGASADPMQITVGLLSLVWQVGMAVMVLYTAFSYWRLRRRVWTAVRLRDNIWQSEQVGSPFVLGLIRPRIYLPFSMEEQARDHVIAHEQAHLQRRDHWWKPLGFALLTHHWFNPLMWLGYVLLCRDIELACDEKVIRDLSDDLRADYSQALLQCSVSRRSIAACPLAFGEVGVKARVRSVLSYKKPTFWMLLAAIVACVIAAVCFLTDPADKRTFDLHSNNVADLEPARMLEEIADLEGKGNSSSFRTEPEGITIRLDPDFNWDTLSVIPFSYRDDGQTYTAKMKILPQKGCYTVTQRETRSDPDRVFLLEYLLEALRYLPQEEIRQLLPDARFYSIRMVDEGTPVSYDRVLTYTENGAEAIGGWFIHLKATPMDQILDGQYIDAYRGSGLDAIHLFYGSASAPGDDAMNYLGANTFLQDNKVYFALPEFPAGTWDISITGRDGKNTYPYLKNAKLTPDMSYSFGVDTAGLLELYLTAVFTDQQGVRTEATFDLLPAEDSNEAALLQRLASLTAADIDYLEQNGDPIGHEQLAQALSRAAQHPAADPRDPYQFFTLTVHLSGTGEGTAVQGERLFLTAGLTENIVSVRYTDGRGNSQELCFEEEGLYRLIREQYHSEDAIDQTAYDKYGPLLEARAQKNVDMTLGMDGAPVFDGYDIVELTLKDRFERDGSTYQVCHWDVAFTAADPSRYGWAGGTGMDAQGRIRGHEGCTYLAVKTGPTGLQEHRFLFWDIYNGETEEQGREHAIHDILQAFAQTGPNTVAQLGREGKPLPEEDAARLWNLTENGRWTEGAADCIPDCTITLNGKAYTYHAGCGTLSGPQGCWTLPITDRVFVNNILLKYVELTNAITDVAPVDPPQEDWLNSFRFTFAEYTPDPDQNYLRQSFALCPVSGGGTLSGLLDPRQLQPTEIPTQDGILYSTGWEVAHVIFTDDSSHSVSFGKWGDQCLVLLGDGDARKEWYTASMEVFDRAYAYAKTLTPLTAEEGPAARYYDLFAADPGFRVLVGGGDFAQQELGEYAVRSLGDRGAYLMGHTLEEYNAVTQRHFGKTITDPEEANLEYIEGTDRLHVREGRDAHGSFHLRLEGQPDIQNGVITARFTRYHLGEDAIFHAGTAPMAAHMRELVLCAPQMLNGLPSDQVEIVFEIRKDAQGEYLFYHSIK